MPNAYFQISVDQTKKIYYRIATDDWQAPAPVAPGAAISQTNLTHSQSSGGPVEDVLETIWNMHNWIWLVAGSIMQQGCDLLPK